MLKLENVSKTYKMDSGEEIQAVDNVSLDVKEGEIVSIIGPSGCGKSTVFGIVSGLTEGYSGNVLIGGVKSNGTNPDVGIVFQEESTLPWRTTLENVCFGLEPSGVPKKEREEIAHYFINLVGLGGFENSYPSELSGGMRQRTAIARTLAVRPKILLLDEPFGALDEQTRVLMGDQLLQIWEETGQTILLVTHSIIEAVQLSSRVAIMSFRPGQVKRIVDIDLPRPRTPEVIASETFGKLRGLIWNELREEASRGMKKTEEEIQMRLTS